MMCTFLIILAVNSVGMSCAYLSGRMAEHGKWVVMFEQQKKYYEGLIAHIQKPKSGEIKIVKQ